MLTLWGEPLVRCWLRGGSPPQPINDASSKKIKIKIKKDLESPTGKRTGHGHGTQNITVNNTQTPWAAHGIAPLAACFWKKSVLLWGERPHPCPVWA